MAHIAGSRASHNTTLPCSSSIRHHDSPHELSPLHKQKPPFSTTQFPHTYNYPIHLPDLQEQDPTNATMEPQNGHRYSTEESIPHTPEKNLPGGGNWVVQKYVTIYEELRSEIQVV